MRHTIPVDEIGPLAPTMAEAIGSCVHCGFCLPTCPTYVTMEEEMDSPRGRIVLMKEVLEGGIDLEAALPFIDNCLGCRACETACPSGVAYGDLITPFRAYADSHAAGGAKWRGVARGILLHTLQSPSRLRTALSLGRLARPPARALSRHLPATASAMIDLLPRQVRRASPLPSLHPAMGTRRARVRLLAGCAQQALAPQINAATLRVLARNGIEAIVPSDQGCCGALAIHTGAFERARSLARRNLRAFGESPEAIMGAAAGCSDPIVSTAAGCSDPIVSTAAGCSSGMKEYGLLFAGEHDEPRARSFADRVLDISVLLAEVGLVDPPPARRALRLAYHDACHLAHAQSIRAQPRELLEAIGNVTLLEPAEWELCCGSAGIYNLQKPDIAARLGRRKAEALLATRPDLIVTGNIGCIVQIEAHLRALGDETPVLHTIEVLDRAYAGTL